MTLNNLILWDNLSNLLHQSWWVLWYVYLPFTVLIILVIFYLLWIEFNDSTDADFFIMNRIQKSSVLVNSFYLVAGAFFSTFASLLCLFVIYTFGHKFVAWWVYVILVTASFIAGFVVAFAEYCFYWGRLRGFSFSSIGFSWSWKFFANTVFILLQQLFRLRGIFFSYIFMLAFPLYIYYLTFFFLLVLPHLHYTISLFWWYFYLLMYWYYSDRFESIDSIATSRRETDSYMVWAFFGFVLFSLLIYPFSS